MLSVHPFLLLVPQIGSQLLKVVNPKDYIALVSKYLTPEQLVWWVKQDASDWNAFYCFLEKQAKEACWIQVLQNTALSCKQPSAVEKKYIHCSGESWL